MRFTQGWSIVKLMSARPTPTTYVLLGLLALRPWTAYELANQAERSLRYFWPRSQAHVYAEVKRLVTLDFAVATTEENGRRPRTSYAITDAGRAALQEWLATAPAEPQLEVEVLMRLMFADQAGPEQVLGALASTRTTMEKVRDGGTAQIVDYLETGGPFPQRLHIIALMTAFYVEFVDLVARWTAVAEAEVATWPSTKDVGLTPGTRELLERIVADLAAERNG